MKLGQKVNCHGYLKKINGLKYIYANQKHFNKNNINGIEEEPDFYLEDIEVEDGEYTQKTMELLKKEFSGIVVGIKSISTANLYTQASESIYDPVTFGYVDERYIDAVKVEKTGYVGCYLVFYAFGKSRLVPIEAAEEVEE